MGEGAPQGDRGETGQYDMLAQITDHFADSIDAKVSAAEALPPSVAQAAGLLVHTLVHEGKVLVCGHGRSAAAAQYFTSALLDRFERDRPGLPALSLSTDPSTLTSIASSGGHHTVFSRQIRALGQPGDVLLLVCIQGRESCLVQSIQAAHDREMSVIVLTGQDGGDCSSLLHNEDVAIRVPEARTIRIREVHLLILHCLHDLIDTHLFGSNDHNEWP